MIPFLCNRFIDKLQKWKEGIAGTIYLDKKSMGFVHQPVDIFVNPLEM
jgi:hypothetical protein